MNIRARYHRRVRGFLLVESVVYIAVVFVAMALGFAAFFQALTAWSDLNRNAGDIARALQAGERWRADVRASGSDIQWVEEPDYTACELPQADGLVVYIFYRGAVWRQEAEKAPQLVLANVARSTMLREERRHVTAWSWELELESKKKVVRIRPLFTFRAVPMLHPAP